MENLIAQLCYAVGNRNRGQGRTGSECIMIDGCYATSDGQGIQRSAVFKSGFTDRADTVAILYILRTMDYERLIIFGNRKDVNLRLQYDLARYGYEIPVLSGDITQAKRIKILERFRSGKERVVIATDVAARGIHVDDISLVINYDLPEQPEDYIHRIGRTGRAGHRGTAISFLCEYGAYYLPAIEELLGTQFSSILPGEEMLLLPEAVKNPKLPEREESRKSHRPHRDGNRRSNRFRR